MNAKAKQPIATIRESLDDMSSAYNDPPRPVSNDRAKMLAQIDALEANGAPPAEVAALRDGVRALRLPADTVAAHITYADAVIGAAQLTTLVKLFGDRMPDDSSELLLRIAAALAGAR